jgi:hypothetical protein
MDFSSKDDNKEYVSAKVKEIAGRLKSQGVEVVTKTRGTFNSLSEAFDAGKGYDKSDTFLANETNTKPLDEKGPFDKTAISNALKEKAHIERSARTLSAENTARQLDSIVNREKPLIAKSYIEEHTKKDMHIKGPAPKMKGFVQKDLTSKIMKRKKQLDSNLPRTGGYTRLHNPSDSLASHIKGVKQTKRVNMLKNVGKGALVAGGVGAAAYGGKKLYDHFNKNAQEEKTATLLGDRYPVQTIEQIEKAASYWKQNWREFTPVERKEYCEKLAARMEDFMIKVPADIQKYASNEYALDCELAVNARKSYVHDEFHPVVENLIEKIGQVSPHTYAKAVETFDKEMNLEGYYDAGLRDPYATTFGKIADEGWRYNNKDVYLNEEQLNCLKTQYHKLKHLIGEKAEKMILNPVEEFKKLPEDQKYIVGRFAQQRWAQGNLIPAEKTASFGAHAAELAGLGILARPSVQKLQGKDVSEHSEHMHELAGLGVLAAPSAASLGSSAYGKVKGLLNKAPRLAGKI